MKLRFRESARWDIRDIHAHIFQWSPEGAANVARDIYAACRLIGEHPLASPETSDPLVRVKKAFEGGLGLRVYQGLTEFGGRPHKIDGMPWMDDDAEKNKLGEEYIAALSPLLSSAQTSREVMRAVSQLSPEIARRVSTAVFP